MFHKTGYKRSILIYHFVILIIAVSHLNAEDKNSAWYNKEGWEYLKRGDDYKAIFSFKNAINKNSKYSDALMGLGNAYYEVGAYDQSIDFFNQVLKIDKNSHKAMVGLGLTMTKLGRYSQAMDYFNNAIKISEESVDAKFGIANLYYSMDKILWTKRKVESILKVHPYHLDTLLLMADLKSRDNRLKDARKYAEKAIEINSESPRGFNKLGEILFRDYLNNENADSLESAREAIRNALSIQPVNYDSNRIMGNIFLSQGMRSVGDRQTEENFLKEAADYFASARKAVNNSSILYSLAIANDLIGDVEAAIEFFLLAFKESPFDSILLGRMEDFLVLRDFKIGHPAREMLNRDYQRLVKKSIEKNLLEEIIFYSRRALLLNPLDREARENLINYYSALDYNRFYIDELKNLLRLYPEKKYQDMLGTAVLKRRARLYHREGFSQEMPPRDVPRILVLNFDSQGTVSEHPDAGEVIGNMLTFAMNQFGRMNPVGIRKRAETVRGLFGKDNYLRKSMEAIAGQVGSGKLEPVDFIVYGNYRENSNYISINCSIIDLQKGVVIDEFNLSESGKEFLPRLSLRAAKRIYNIIPYKGRILKLTDEGIIINLGAFDGLTPGDKVAVYKYNDLSGKNQGAKEKIIFSIQEADTVISYAVTEKKGDLDLIYASDQVFPLKKRRAKLIK